MLNIDVKKTLGTKTFEYQIKTSKKVIAIMGSSGAGKTTLLKILAGLIPVSEGNILEGSVGFVFQKNNLLPHLSVSKNMALGFTSTLDKEEEIDKWLSKVGVSEIKNKKPKLISGGEEQRVALARALMRNPDYLLLDEPFSSLDRENRQMLYSVLNNLLQSFQGTTIIVTHNLKEAYQFADEIYLLKDCKLKKIPVSLKEGVVIGIENRDYVRIITVKCGEEIVRTGDVEGHLEIGDQVVCAGEESLKLIRKW